MRHEVAGGDSVYRVLSVLGRRTLGVRLVHGQCASRNGALVMAMDEEFIGEAVDEVMQLLEHPEKGVRDYLDAAHLIAVRRGNALAHEKWPMFILQVKTARNARILRELNARKEAKSKANSDGGSEG